MPPLRKAPPASHRRRAVDDDGRGVQAGRSSTSLGAERATADIRRKPLSPHQRYSENLVGSSQRIEQRLVRRGREAAMESLDRRASYVPAVPSPFNPSSSQTSVGGNEYTGLSGTRSPVTPRPPIADTPPDPSSGNIPQTGREGRRGSRTPNPVQQIPRGRPTFMIPPSHRPRPERPKLLHDLGRDYSRYPSSISTPSSYAGRSSYLESPVPKDQAVVSTESKSSLISGTAVNSFYNPQSNLEKCGYPDDSIGALDPYFGGEKGFILYKDEIEPDDKHHLPVEDDDRTYRPKLSDYCYRRAMVSGIGGLFLVTGLIFLFIILPFLTYSSRVYNPLGHHNQTSKVSPGSFNNNTYSLLTSVRTGLIDPDTPEHAKTRKSAFDGSTLNLVFSDEFNQDGRTFYEGDDPYWTAPDIWYGATKDLEWYDSHAVTTRDGTLQIRMDEFRNHDLQYRSGMLNSWNQLCFKGGVFEVSVSLAGPAGVPGLWPGLWAMGNLGRPGYRATTDGIWPYTYNTCDYGILPNQSSPDGISWLPGQRLSSCTCKGEDHPNRGTGRGAPEIDVIEAGADPNSRIGAVTQSYQVAPFDVWYRPNYNFVQIPNNETTSINTYCGGPFQQAISGTTMLNNKWYDGNAYQKYAFEYIPGNASGKIAWFVGEQQSFLVDGRSIAPNGNVGPRQVSEEPMSMVMNLGMSNSWTQIFMSELKFPTIMHVDYVRVYQKPGQPLVTCDPPGYPTTEYIAEHAAAYRNPNFTSWEEAGFRWPKNKLTGC